MNSNIDLYIATGQTSNNQAGVSVSEKFNCQIFSSGEYAIPKKKYDNDKFNDIDGDIIKDYGRFEAVERRYTFVFVSDSANVAKNNAYSLINYFLVNDNVKLKNKKNGEYIYSVRYFGGDTLKISEDGKKAVVEMRFMCDPFAKYYSANGESAIEVVNGATYKFDSDCALCYPVITIEKVTSADFPSQFYISTGDTYNEATSMRVSKSTTGYFTGPLVIDFRNKTVKHQGVHVNPYNWIDKFIPITGQIRISGIGSTVKVSMVKNERHVV